MIAALSAINHDTYLVNHKAMAKKLTVTQKYSMLKKQTEQAGMMVMEKNGKLVVTRKKKKK